VTDNRFPQVYLRRKSPRPSSVQASEPNPKNEVIPSDLSQSASELDWPMAIRKGTRECTKQPRYSLSDFVSSTRLSPCYKCFLTNLNSVSIPNTLSEALTYENWRNAINVEMRALEKNKT